MANDRPPGWYSDQSGLYRYWDGQQWLQTPSERTMSAELAQAPTATRPTVEKPPRTGLRGWLDQPVGPWLIAGVLLLTVPVVGLTIALFVSREPSSPAAASSTVATSPAAAMLTPTRPTIATPIVSPEQLDRTSYRAISQRDFQKILKDPYSYYGERIIIYGKVTRFVSQTGLAEFQSPVMGEPYNPPGENSIITAPDPSILDDVVVGDSLKMFVEIDGTKTYRSQIGSQVTGPSFAVYVVEPFTAR